MSKQDDDTEKSHEPTPQKLLEARKKGEVVRSADLTTAASYGGFLLAGLVVGVPSIQGISTAMMALLDQADPLSEVIFKGSGASALTGLVVAVSLSLLGWYLIPSGMALLSVIAQRSFVVSGEKIMPKLNRLSLIQNAKKKFGPSGLFEFAKNFVKLVVYSICLGLYLNYRLDDMAATLFGSPQLVGALMMRMLIEFMFVVLLIALVIGGLDFVWQRFDFMRQHRMSYRELQEEHKSSEGDPHLKQERRQRGARIASEQMMSDVPTADVVIVNPTHYAVALKWSREPGSAPVCIAKGVDHVALAIRECAMEHGVPVRHDPPTARALHATTDIGQEIDTDHYRAVAASIRFADDMRRRARSFG
ncbi:EscU/YscU/HrcU family type III secretion system export apparatus switch protein [Roseovarius sp. 2305UL8-3]|uniref:EscU/YscU/HrcU family type III secretion system export apparatus switch protein n=1 Tax=Roseovarius conchicola TaxID=3121636 RepID=UPI003529CFE5